MKAYDKLPSTAIMTDVNELGERIIFVCTIHKSGAYGYGNGTAVTIKWFVHDRSFDELFDTRYVSYGAYEEDVPEGGTALWHGFCAYELGKRGYDGLRVVCEL